MKLTWDPHSITGHLRSVMYSMTRLTHSSWSDGLACNSFLQLQFSCSEEQSAAVICSFSSQHPCLTAGLCTQTYFCDWKLPQTPTTVPYTGYFKQEKSSLFFIFFSSFLLAKKRHGSKCSLTILLMGAHKYINGLSLPSLLSSHHTASSQSISCCWQWLDL